MANYCILGRHGFLGSALEKKLGKENVSSFPTKDTKILFDFASPVHPPFEENPDYHMHEALSSFMYLLPYCRDNGIKFVYPSSALVYEKDTVFAKFKKTLESLASCYPNTLGLRIFPVYGPGEHRTVISQWCKAMKKGERPVIWGDGTQKRDFIYVDDAVNSIIEYAHLDNGIADIGNGNPVSFNLIYQTINNILGTDIQPIFKKFPKEYSLGIKCQNPGLQTVNLKDGITRILESTI